MATPKFPFIGHDNRFSDAVPVASSTQSGAAINISDFRSYTYWKPTALPATVTVDSAVAKSVDCLCLFNHDLFSNGCTIEVRGSTDNFVASDVLVYSYTPTSDVNAIKNFTSASYRYWRIKITGATAPTLSIAAIGVGLEFPTGLPFGFDPIGRKIHGQTNVSEAGLPLGKAILFEEWKQSLSFEFITNQWARNTFLPAWKLNIRGKPFMFAWDLTNFPDEVYVVEAGMDLSLPQTTPVYTTLGFEVKGVALP